MGRNYNAALFRRMERVPGVVPRGTFDLPIERNEAVSLRLGQVATFYLGRIAQTDESIEDIERAQIQRLGRRLTCDEAHHVRFGSGSGEVLQLETTAFTRWLAKQTRTTEAEMSGDMPMRLYFSRHSMPEGELDLHYQRMGQWDGVRSSLAHLSVGSRGVILRSNTGPELDITNVPGVAEVLHEDAETLLAWGVAIT